MTLRRSPWWVLVSLVVIGPAEPPRAAAAPKRPVVIAIVGDTGINVLHRDFARRDVALPPGMPPSRAVRLPATGDFAERAAAVQAGPLGAMEPGVLYTVTGTNLIGVIQPDPRFGRPDLLIDRDHGTGVAAAAAGRTFGTDPDALLVFVYSNSPAGFEWVARQPWIDLISTSYLTGPPGCPEHHGLRQFAAGGGLAFAAAGNGEQVGMVSSPSAHPDTYHVGGVNAEGRTWTYLDETRRTPPAARGNPTRPYETGELFDFPSAHPSALDGPEQFGGTSGAAPRTAGRAARLVRLARDLVRAPATGRAGGVLARGPMRTRSGPLADGVLTRDELISLLHHVAVPYEAPSPVRYLVEGYGAINDAASARAERVLRGLEPEPARPDEDAMHARVRAMHEASYPSQRPCG